ncbi:probable inactive receptor kinase At1g48480 [Euphorbia lathyris]|uniref:probable inactive receptor kinase At1g48480 n=1 Tax=Euphorbia lathyris TaxID=212925 RepID=UPI00331434BD
MGFHQFLKKFAFLILISSSLAHELQLEQNALLALKSNFNNPFLNINWSGPQCPLRYPTQWYGISCENGRVSEILLENLGLIGIISFDAFSVFGELKTLSLRNNSISGEVMDFSSNSRIRKIDLSGNEFRGPISMSLMNLESLESFQVQDNFLTGSIPEFNQSSLAVFNVSNNNLDGQIPETYVMQLFGSDCYNDNPKLCGPPSRNACKNDLNGASSSDIATPPSGQPKKSFSGPNIGTMFLLVDIVGLVAVILLFILYLRKAKKLKKILKRYKNIEEGKEDQETTKEFEDEQDKSSIEAKGKDVVVVAAAAVGSAAGDGAGNLIFLEGRTIFDLNDLLKASAEGLGKGIFGNTYKAMMEGKPGVVVKRLRDLKPLSVDEFMKHLNVIADLKHPNLMPVLAYYYSKEEKLLMYRFAERGNLFNRIHGGRGKDRIQFRWSSRLSVARGVARALEYLHLNTKPQTINLPHGNLKSSNVFLDENEMVLVSDFGLVSLVAPPIAANGMVSYKSPEYMASKRVSRKSDVWSYGCLMLELLTGRIAAHSAPPGTNGVDLCSWVHRAVREEWTAEIFDVEISAERSSASGMLKLLQIAMRCCEKSPEKRPEMSEIVREVENIKVVESSEEEDLSSMDQSLTDESLSTSASGIIGANGK